MALQDKISSAQFAMKGISSDSDRVERMVRIYLDEILPAATQLRDTQFRLNTVVEEPSPDKRRGLRKNLYRKLLRTISA